MISHLHDGLLVAVTWQNLLYCFSGALLGTLIGVLPGLGPAATIAILLPLTFALPPDGALIMLAGIFYGSQYGGSTTAILVNLPGEASSVVTALDGYKMAQQGRAGEALAIAALSSFFAGCVATLVIAAVAIPLSKLALVFGAPEYFSLMCFGLLAAVALAHGSFIKAVAMILVGLALGLVGLDVYSSVGRYTFSMPNLVDGLSFVPIAMGLFGVVEILKNLESDPGQVKLVDRKRMNLWPSRETVRRAVPATVRGTILGSLVGILPGGGATLSAFSAYALERKVSKRQHEFGHGAVEGVAGPEAANNAGAQTSMIPMLTLGIPTNAVTALMIGALMVHGIRPGPMVIETNADLFWGLIVSMWIGNAFLVIINLPLIGLWAKILDIPYKYLFPSILIFSCVGVYTVSNSVFDVYVLLLFSVVGYLLYKMQFEPAPLLLGFVLGPMLEENFRRAMLLSQGDFAIFIERPISLAFLVLSALLVIAILLPFVRKNREAIFVEEES